MAHNHHILYLPLLLILFCIAGCDGCGNKRGEKEAPTSRQQQLLDRWKREFTADHERQEARKAFEVSQRERGLVKHQGEWVTTDELAFHQAQLQLEAAEEARKALEQELEQLKKRVATLEEENAALQEEVRRQIEEQETS